MSDQIEEIFARTRPTAIQAIRPPGAEAARRTVRIRRRRRVVGLAAVVVLAVVGGVVTRMSPAPPPELPADPVRMTQTAKVALGTSALPAALEKAAEVTPTWSSSSPVYHGELTLRAACAGAGEITLAVVGNPGGESSQTEPFELARLKVPCSPQPEPVETAFEPSGAISLDYKIVESTIASRSGFAYRLTSDTGKPFAMGDDQANPTAALHLTSDEGFGTGGSLTARRPGWKDDLPSHVGGDFRILAACTGDGTLVVEILKKSGKVVDTVRVPCHWPPKRYDFEPARGTGDLYYRISYQHITMPSTDFAVQFVPK